MAFRRQFLRLGLGWGPTLTGSSPSSCRGLSLGSSQPFLGFQSEQLDSNGKLQQQEPATWRCMGRRAFASHAEQRAITDAVLQQVQVHKLREELKDESERCLYISFQDFKDRAISSRSAETDKQAEELCGVLQRAGVVLRHNDLVYLRVDEIAEMVSLVLPGGREDAQNKLEKVEAELAELDAIHSVAERSAKRQANVILVGGFVVLFTQMVAMIYLTWWELSWDVMEPIAYIISLFYSLVAYSYFLVTRGNVFDLGPMNEFWTRRFKNNKIQKLEFNVERHVYLVKLRDRYKKHLAHMPPFRL